MCLLIDNTIMDNDLYWDDTSMKVLRSDDSSDLNYTRLEGSGTGVPHDRNQVTLNDVFMGN